jgi:hypothetical protein
MPPDDYDPDANYHYGPDVKRPYDDPPVPGLFGSWRAFGIVFAFCVGGPILALLAWWWLK